MCTKSKIGKQYFLCGACRLPVHHKELGAVHNGLFYHDNLECLGTLLQRVKKDECNIYKKNAVKITEVKK